MIVQLVQDADKNSDLSGRLTTGLPLLSITAGMNYGVVLATTRTIIKNRRGDVAHTHTHTHTHTHHSLHKFMTGLYRYHHCPPLAPARGSYRGLEWHGGNRGSCRTSLLAVGTGSKSLSSCHLASHILTQHKASNQFTSLKTEQKAFDVTLICTHARTRARAHTHTRTRECRRALSLTLTHDES